MSQHSIFVKISPFLSEPAVRFVVTSTAKEPSADIAAMHGTTPTRQIPPAATHGAERLPSVVVESYNIEAKDEDGFVGDRATRGAFRELLDKWRKVLRQSGDDPFGENESDDIGKKK